MSTNYSAQVLTSAIAQIRGQVLGCVFALPTADGGAVDPGSVNVEYSLGSAPIAIDKRATSSETCTTDGCWDYTSNGQVELIGKACTDVQGAMNAKVSIVVGCKTVVK